MGGRSRRVASMPERLDRVTILLTGGPVVISWDERTALLTRMNMHEPAGRTIKTKFSAVGATRPVELTTDEKTWLLNLIDNIATTAGIRELGDGLRADLVRELDNALHADLHDPAERG